MEEQLEFELEMIRYCLMLQYPNKTQEEITELANEELKEIYE